MTTTTTTSPVDEVERGRAGLTPPQREVFDLIRWHVDRRGYAPSVDDVATALHVAYRVGLIADLRAAGGGP